MKKNTGAVCLSLGLKRFSLERPRVLRKLKCHIWQAPELSVLSWGSLSRLFSPVSVLLLFFLYVCLFFYLNVWRGIELLDLVRRWFNFCGTLINCLSVRGWSGERRRRGNERRLGTFAPKTHQPCSMAHVNSLLRVRKRRSESWGLVPDTCTEDSMRYGGTPPSRHSPPVILTFLPSSSPLRLPGSPTFFFNKFFREKNWHNM